jgi:hypothetical protein
MIYNAKYNAFKERLDKKLKEFIQIKKLENPYMTTSDFTFYEITNQCRIIIIDENCEYCFL